MFPSSVIIDGKKRILSERKHCLECIPFESHNRKQYSIADNSDKECICEECNKSFIYSKGKHNSSKRCNSCYVRIYRQKLKTKAVEYKGGKCKRCGYNSNIKALQFHHRNPDEKEFSINGLAMKWEKVVIELDKCELLCANCHIEVHDELFISSLQNNFD